jgi:hypothetical protein
MGKEPASKDHDKYEAFDIYEDKEEGKHEISRTYEGFIKRKRLLLVAGFILLFVSVIVAAQSGPIDLPFLEVARYIVTLIWMVQGVWSGIFVWFGLWELCLLVRIGCSGCGYAVYSS